MTPQRICVIGVGSTGDVLPQAWLAAALARRGHDITLLAPEPFAEVAGALGVRFVPVLSRESFEATQRHPDLWKPFWQFIVEWPDFLAAARNTMDWLAHERAQGRPTTVVGNTLAFGARLARDRWRWPQATVHVSPCWLWSDIAPPRFHGLAWVRWLPPRLRRAVRVAAERSLLAPACLPGFNRLRADWGLKPIRRLLGPWLHSPDLSLGLFPDWFAAPQADWPGAVRLTGFVSRGLPGLGGVPAELQSFLDAGDAPLVFTQASLMVATPQWLRWASDVTRRLGRRAVLLGVEESQWREALGVPLPAGLHAQPRVPLECLLPRAAALVGHGGIGTIALALRAGCPMLLQAHAGDHFDNVQRCVRLGVARELPVRSSAALAAASLNELLTDPATRAATQLAQRRMAEAPDALEAACDAMEALIVRRSDALN